jgi:4'-phosphopantetheinyl transferase EntD
LEQILPSPIVVEEERGDPSPSSLSPQEQALVARAVEKRRREFSTARLCARRALERLDLPPQPILSGARGEPLWPVGVVGSITHCHGYRACALARASEILALGIDAEPHAPLPDGVLAQVAGPHELQHLRLLARAAPDVHWDRLLFSAKESVYKAWYPLARRPLGFEDAEIVLDPHAAIFSARLLTGGLRAAGRSRGTLSGRWLAGGGLVLTAVLVAADGVGD